jgi:hypothetical protein
MDFKGFCGVNVPKTYYKFGFSLAVLLKKLK